MTTDPIKALVDLKALAEAATPGPWEWHDDNDDIVFGPYTLGTDGPDLRNSDTKKSVLSPFSGQDTGCLSITDEDKAFIAAANPKIILAAIEALTPIAAGGRVMGEIEAEALRLEKEAVNLPFEIEKWLMTIKAHCTVIADPGPDDNVRDLAHHIKINVDGDLRSALHTALAASPSASTGKDEAVERVAIALHLHDFPRRPWEEVEEIFKNQWRSKSRAALAAINGEK